MYKKQFYINSIFRILLIIILTVIATQLVIKNYFLLPFFFGLIIIYLIYSLLSYYNKTHQKITYFFDAVENNDSTLHFPEKIKDKNIQDLNKSLNRVNALIQEVKLKNKEQEQYYSVLLEQVPTGIIVINKNGNILQANSSAKKLLNYETLTHIVQLKKVDENLYQSLKVLNEGGRHQLVYVQYKNHITQLALRSNKFILKHDTFTLISVQDIKSELDSKEIDSWIKLVRVLTHEIMNSITPIVSLSETLTSYYNSKESIIKAEELDDKTIINTLKGLEVIQERGQGLMRFVDSYRKLTKIPPPNPTFFKIKPWLERLLILIQSEESKDVKITINTATEDLTFFADEIQLSQVVINLLKNAIEALKETAQPKINITAETTKEHKSIISISDNGHGISEEIIENIFVPFFTTKNNGSGIGLSLSRQIMRLHGGTIKVQSQLDKGTTFQLIF